MVDINKVKEFLEATDKDWRTRYQYVKAENFSKMSIKDDGRVKKKLVNIAHFDPSSIVRQEAVKTCNLSHILYKKKPVKLRKMRSLANTLKAMKIDISEVCVKTLMAANLSISPKKRNLNEKELNLFYDTLKKEYPKLYDLLDGHFTTRDDYIFRKAKDKTKVAMEQKHNPKFDRYVYGMLMYIPKNTIQQCFPNKEDLSTDNNADN